MKTFKQSPFLLYLMTFLILIIGQTTEAQDQFNLSDYKNPDYRWHLLDINFGLGGSNNFGKQIFEEGDDYKSSESIMNGNLGLNYFGKRNSSSYQGYQNATMNTDIQSYWYNHEILNQDDSKDGNNYKTGSLGINIETINRFYGKKKRFLEMDLEFNGALNKSTQKYSEDDHAYPFLDKTTIRYHRLSASLPLLVGIGRIEEVQDARLAVYILDDLTASGDLTRNATKEEILAFSECITTIKNQRFFDARLRKIAEITAIDSFLTVSGLKAESDASYYTLINDNWNYANGPVRSTGSRFSLGLIPILGLTFDENALYYLDTLVAGPDPYENFTALNRSLTDAYGLNFVAAYTWEKPANLYWQHSFEGKVSYSLYSSDENVEIYERDTLQWSMETVLNAPGLRAELFYKIGFYPNSRTTIMLTINSAFNQQWDKQTIDEGEEDDLGSISVDNAINLSCYYYISQRVRFMFGLNSHYAFTKLNQENDEDYTGNEFDHDFDNLITAGLTYSIF